MTYRRIAFIAASVILALPARAQDTAVHSNSGASRQSSQEAGGRARADLDSLSIVVHALARDPFGIAITSADSVTRGGRMVAAAQRIQHDVVTYRGDLTVRGIIEGNAIALQGNVILEPGSSVLGDAIAVGGLVRQGGGAVGGEIRELSRIASPGVSAGAAAVSTVQATRRALALVGAWLLVLAALGAGVFIFARSNLEAIADTIRDDFGRSLLVGIAAELALLPALVILIVGLAITLIGILLIPFVVVAYFTAAAGALALAFIAFAYVTGDSVVHRWRGGAGASGFVLLLVGVLVFFLLWVLAALFTFAGGLSPVLRAVASLITWLAVTVGFGATLVSRGGTLKMAPSSETAAIDDYTWQTPTPVTGVMAARRPTPASSRLNAP